MRSQGWDISYSGFKRSQGRLISNSGFMRSQGWDISYSGFKRSQGRLISNSGFMRSQGWDISNSGFKRSQGRLIFNSGSWDLKAGIYLTVGSWDLKVGISLNSGIMRCQCWDISNSGFKRSQGSLALVSLPWIGSNVYVSRKHAFVQICQNLFDYKFSISKIKKSALSIKKINIKIFQYLYSRIWKKA